MKKTLFPVVILLYSLKLFSQEYSFSAGPSWGIPFYYHMVTGGPGKTPKTGMNVNFEYIFPSERKISWGTGIGFQNNRVELTPQYYGNAETVEGTIFYSNILYLSSKLIFRKRNSSNFSLDPIVGVQLNKTTYNSFSNQSGLGFGFNYVKKFSLKEKTFLKIESKLTIFNIIPFKSDGMAERMTSIGVNAGFGIRE